MSALTIEVNPIDSGPWMARELSATYSSLRIRVGEAILTRHHDARLSAVVDDLHVPTYPLAEWASEHWWNLLYEQPAARDPEGFERRHNTKFAREGFVLPSLRFSPQGDEVRLSWRPERLEHTKVSFLSGDDAVLPLGQVRETLLGLILQTKERLVANGLLDLPLIENANLIQASWSDFEERAYCRVVAALGLDPYDLPDTVQKAVMRAARLWPQETLFELASTGPFKSFVAASAALARVVATMSRPLSRLVGLGEWTRRLARDVRFGEDVPWREGYVVARRLGAELNRSETPRNDFASLLEILSIPAERRLASVSANDLGHELTAVTRLDAQGVPAIALMNGPESMRAFALARAVFGAIVGKPNSTQVATRAQTHFQKAARAFAAEFLAPAAALKRQISRASRPLAAEDYEFLAERFGVSTLVIQHQVENHGLA